MRREGGGTAESWGSHPMTHNGLSPPLCGTMEEEVMGGLNVGEEWHGCLLVGRVGYWGGQF